MPTSREGFLARFALQPLTIEDHKAEAPHQAAVMLPLVEGEAGFELLLTRRSANLRHHAGQISFPGGRRDESDESLLQTAQRECLEEIGVQPHTVYGRLPLYVSNSGFAVTPFVGLLAPNYQLSLNPDEVVDAFQVPLNHLFNPSNHIRYSVTRGARTLDVYWIPWQGHFIWGVTAGILHNLYSHLYGLNPRSERY